MRANPTVIGAFVVGALVLAFASVLLFGSGDMFEDKSYAYMFFDEPVDGLSIGSPVKLHGVQIGAVVDVHLEWIPEKDAFQVPVLVEFHRSVGERAAKLTDEERLAARQRLIDKGMRAALKTESFITGKLAITIEYYPDEPARYVGGPDLKYPEFPTVKAGLTKFLEELSKLPIRELFDEAIVTIRSIRQRVESKEVT